jgi:hypothetical protein
MIFLNRVMIGSVFFMFEVFESAKVLLERLKRTKFMAVKLILTIGIQGRKETLYIILWSWNMPLYQ